jgi:polyhydroxyalkanoate synthase subunit PhaC
VPLFFGRRTAVLFSFAITVAAAHCRKPNRRRRKYAHLLTEAIMQGPRMGAQFSLAAFWAYADQVRRRQGRLLDQWGFGPQTTSARVVRQWSVLDLLAYQEPNATQPVLLIVPAPIKAAYIWDLAREVSVVQHCLRAGLQVYLMAWRRPRRGDEALGLAHYAGRMVLESAEAAAAETGQPRLFIAGHSLGGTLAAVFGSLHPDRLRGLIAVEAPIHFPRDQGRLESSATRAPAAADVARMFGNVPGSFLSMTSSWADPATFNAEPWADWWNALSSARARRLYMQVRRWTLNEAALPQRLYEDIVDGLYREDRFVNGTLCLHGIRVDPRALTAPILAIADARSRIVPPASVEAFRHCTGSKDVELINYPGDVGVMLQHVGVLIGDNAHRTIWPRTVAWIHQRAAIPA